MSKLRINSLVLGMVATNCYLVQNTETEELLIVDPADSPERIGQQAAKMGGRVCAVLLTHGHFDHMTAADACRKKYGVPIYACGEEREVLRNPSYNLSGMWASPLTLEADVYVEDKELLNLAGFEIEVLHTPGHTAGSVCYYIRAEHTLLSGDTLFAGSYGRTDFPTASMQKMRESIRRLMELPEDTDVRPGHGEATTIAEEKRYNPLA